MTQDGRGRDLFIVDNSVSGWIVLLNREVIGRLLQRPTREERS